MMAPTFQTKEPHWKRRLACASIAFGVLIALQTAVAHAQTGADYLEYISGGVMSDPDKIQIDLNNGHFVAQSGGIHLPAIHNEGAVDEDMRNKLRDLTRNAINAGLKSQACRGNQHMPSPDSQSALIVSLDGKTDSAGPDYSCFSNAASALLSAIREATKQH